MGPWLEMLPVELRALFEILIRDSWYSGSLLDWLLDLGFLKTLVVRCLRSWKLYLGIHFIQYLILDLGVGKPYGLSWFMALIDCLHWLLLGLRSWLLLDFKLWLLNPSPWIVSIGSGFHACIQCIGLLVFGLSLVHWDS